MLFLALLYGAPALALDPGKALTQYGHRVWRTDEGLPQNSVFSILQAPDGYLWLATQEGLVRFDGVRFTVFDKRNTQQIKHNDVWTLLEDRSGSLWIGTRGGGLSRLQDGEFTNYSKADGLSNDAVHALFEDRQGALWIGTRGDGLSRFKDGKFSSYTTKDGLSSDTVNALYEDRDGALWIGTLDGGLNRFKDGKFTVYSKKDGLSSDTVYSIYQDPQGRLWIGTGAGLDLFQDGKFTVYGTREGLSNDLVRTLLQDRDGNLWIGTDGGGLNRFRDGKFTAFTTKDGLSNDSVGAIYEDREGSLWVGTDGGGLNRFTDSKFTSYTTQEGLSNDNARAIYQDRAGDLWIGTFGGLNRFKDGTFTAYTAKKSGLSSDIVLSIAEDHDGALWLGTLGGGLDRFKDGRVTVYSKKDGLSSDIVMTLLVDHEGTLWIGTRAGGLNRYKDGHFRAYTMDDGLSSNDVRALYEDRNGTLWIGTLGGGLNRLKDGKFTSYTTKNGLSTDLVLALHGEADGTLWLGTYGGGLNRFKDGKFSAITAKDGLFDDVAFQILEDDSGRLWMSSNHGIYRAAKQNLNDFADGLAKSVTSVAYGKADGMKSSECNGAHQPAGWKTRDGRLWFPTIAGIVTIDPQHIRTNALPPPVRVERFVVDGRPVAVRGQPELPPGRKKLEFHYTALSLAAPEKVRFKYRLQGFDREWVDAGANRAAYYTNIPPGNYEFSVIASNDDGVWNRDGALFGFYLAPYFYQRTSFYVFCVLLAAGLVAGSVRFHRVRVRQAAVREKELLTLVNERRRAQDALEEMNRALEQRAAELARSNAELERFAYVASHDLIEPLRSVIGFTQLLAKKYTGKLDAEADKFIRFAVDGALSMQALIDNLLAYSRIGRIGQDLAETDCEAAFKQAVAGLHSAIAESGAAVTHGPLPTLRARPAEIVQLFQNLIGNAIKFRSEKPPLIQVSAEANADRTQWRFCVADNGIGIEPEYADRIFVLFQRLHSKDRYPGTGIGLAICKKIVERHGGRIWVEPAPDQGSQFYFTLPVAPA